MQRVHLILLIDPALGLMMAAQFPEFDGGNLEGTSFSEHCRSRQRRDERSPRECHGLIVAPWSRPPACHAPILRGIFVPVYLTFWSIGDI
jgi:hypothetical protein